MNLSIYGYGSMGKRHSQNAVAAGCRVAVSDPALGLFIPTHWTPDAAVIAAPAAMHVSLIRELRCPLLVEKPLALSKKHFDLLLRSSLPTLHVAYNLRFHTGIQTLRKRLAVTGPITSATFRIHCDKAGWPGSAYGDMLIEGSHEIDLALYLFGPAACVGATGSGDAWTVLLEHHTGVMSTVILDGTHRGYRRRIEIYGPNCNLIWDWNTTEWTLVGTGCAEGRPWDDGDASVCTPDDTYRAEMSEFLTTMASPPHRNATLCSLNEALSVLEICDAARAMAERPF